MSNNSPLIVAVKNPRNVRYLAFEGGGGKGAAYLGAIEVLEQKKVLPLKTAMTPDGTRQVRGFAGSSAGALTAFLLSLGYTSQQLGAIIRDKKALQRLYEDPVPAAIRGMNNSKFLEMIIPNVDPSSARKPKKSSAFATSKIVKRRKDWPGLVLSIGQSQLLKHMYNTLADDPDAFIDMVGPTLRTLLSQIKKEKAGVGGVNFLTESRTKTHLQDYLYAFVYDRGIFPGFGLRSYLKSLFDDFLVNVLGEDNNGETITFKRLKEITDVELVITGVNITHHKPAYFSHKDTPNFPVIDAVAISMSFPMLFKPTWVANDKKVASGYWADGGVLNNMPIHAFDKRNGISLSRNNKLNDHVLGIRLDQKNPLGPKILSAPEKLFGKNGKKVELHHVLSMHVGDLLSTLLYPSEDGQLRNLYEQAQTVSLPTKGKVDKFDWELSTTKFLYSEKTLRAATIESRKCMLQYFQKSP